MNRLTVYDEKKECLIIWKHDNSGNYSKIMDGWVGVGVGHRNIIYQSDTESQNVIYLQDKKPKYLFFCFYTEIYSLLRYR